MRSDILKKTRHSLEVEGDDGAEIILGSDGVAFDFENDAGCDVDFCEASIKENEISNVIEFIQELYT